MIIDRGPGTTMDEIASGELPSFRNYLVKSSDKFVYHGKEVEPGQVITVSDVEMKYLCSTGYATTSVV